MLRESLIVVDSGRAESLWFSFAGISDSLDVDDIAYTTLGYANGPGYVNNTGNGAGYFNSTGARANLTGDVTSRTY